MAPRLRAVTSWAPAATLLLTAAAVLPVRDLLGGPPAEQITWPAWFVTVALVGWLVLRTRAAHRQARTERDFTAAVLGAMRDAYAVTRDGVIVDVNPQLTALTGFSREELVGAARPWPFWPPELVEDHEAVRQAVVSADGGDFEVELVRRDGSRCTVSMTARSAHDPDGHLVFITSIRDVTTERRRERDLAFRADHDALTGLLNRGTFLHRLQERLEDARTEDRDLSLVLLDVDHFKAINDTLGHPAGDAALAGIAEHLRRGSRGDDLLARVGGEEFAWLVADADAEAARLAVERLRGGLGELRVGTNGAVTASAGVCAAVPGTSAEVLYAAADAALYVAKGAGRDRVAVGSTRPEALPA